MSDLLYKDECFEIVGASMEVLNTVKHGFREEIYENALLYELELRGFSCEQQREFAVRYKTRFCGMYRPDILVDSKIIVDAKTIQKIGDSERGQMINYLKVTGCRLGLVINFKHAELEWERVVL